MFAETYKGKRVWISGHTGFKGAWFGQWLLGLGAEVHGFALPPPSEPALFEQLGLGDRLKHEEGDVRDGAAVRASIGRVQPDYVFHMAAQSLVRAGYADPVETFAVNVQGTVHVLEALRGLDKPCAAVFVTTDKCYENREWVYGYREDDPLGGRDPYSASKAAAELAVGAYRRSFFMEHPVRVATARAGNVIGGGDWAADRIVPDCIRALKADQIIEVRHPTARRPWQHVLDPLSGYLWLAAALSQPNETAVVEKELLASAFNFGPGPEANRTVRELVEQMLEHWPGQWEARPEINPVHEARLLFLNTDKARALLGWRPVWNFFDSVARTVQWYRQTDGGEDVETFLKITQRQIDDYGTAARELQLPWA